MTCDVPSDAKPVALVLVAGDDGPATSGYVEVGRVEEYPIGHAKLYFAKRLGEPGASSHPERA